MKSYLMNTLMIMILVKQYIKAFLETLHRRIYPIVKSESSQNTKKNKKDEIKIMDKHFNGKSYVKDGIESDF